MKNTKKNIIDSLFALERKGIKPGLERTLAVLEEIGNPHLKFPTIHIAGTNGKGSTASLIASILCQSVLNTGLYTSPHIKDFNERIKIGNKKIDDSEMIEIAEKLLDIGHKYDATFFELTTALAFEYFAQNKVDIAVIETGLGGRFDSTNVLNPLISVITSIDIDHTDFLGNTLQEIAYEKAGIIKANTPCIVGETKSEAVNVIIEVALQQCSELVFAESYKIDSQEILNNFTMKLNIESENSFYTIETPLVGEHQAINHILAIASIEKICKHFNISEENIINGIKNVKSNTDFHGRIDKISDEPIIILDTAHNPAAFNVLKELVSNAYPKEKFNLLFGAMSDKDIASMLRNIKPIVNKIIICSPATKRAESVENINKIALELGFENIIQIQNPQSAYEFVKGLNENFIVAGSFYLIGDINI